MNICATSVKERNLLLPLAPLRSLLGIRWSPPGMIGAIWNASAPAAGADTSSAASAFAKSAAFALAAGAFAVKAASALSVATSTS